MTPAYDKLYLGNARVVLGRMLDFAVHDLKYDADHFFQLFITSGVAARFEYGDFTVTVGKSGVELAYEVLEKAEIEHQRIKPIYTLNRRPEYWAGWALAYYQWVTAATFADIIKKVPIKDIIALYAPYHEMDIRHFVDKMNQLCNRESTGNPG